MRTRLPFVVCWLVVCVAALVIASCGEGPGSRGNVFVMVNSDASIASVDVTALDLPSNPSTLVPYQAGTHLRRVTWTTTGAINYAAYVDFRAHPGKDETEECILIFCTVKPGEDGEDRTFLLEFSSSNMTVSEVQSIKSGTIY